jgi:hypothetical protein
MRSSATIPRDGVIPDQGELGVLPTSSPARGKAGDPAAMILQCLAEDHERIAVGMNEIVVHRLFSAGLSLAGALALMGDHPGAGKVQDAIGELDLAIRDFRNVLFDHHQPDSPPRGQPG